MVGKKLNNTRYHCQFLFYMCNIRLFSIQSNTVFRHARSQSPLAYFVGQSRLAALYLTNNDRISFARRVIPLRGVGARAFILGTSTTKQRLNRATVSQQLYERLTNECRSTSDSYNAMIGRRADSVAVTDSITAPTA